MPRKRDKTGGMSVLPNNRDMEPLTIEDEKVKLEFAMNQLKKSGKSYEWVDTQDGKGYVATYWPDQKEY